MKVYYTPWKSVWIYYLHGNSGDFQAILRFYELSKSW